jgi:hypothetical protein
LAVGGFDIEPMENHIERTIFIDSKRDFYKEEPMALKRSSDA